MCAAAFPSRPTDPTTPTSDQMLVVSIIRPFPSSVLGIIPILLLAAVLTACGLRYDAVQMRQAGQPLRSVEMLTGLYQERPSPATEKQIYLSVTEAAEHLGGRYSAVSQKRSLNEVEDEIERLDYDRETLVRAMEATEDPESTCSACPELRRDAVGFMERMESERNAAKGRQVALRKELAEVVAAGNAAIANRNPDGLKRAAARFEVLWTTSHVVLDAWHAVVPVLESPSSASSNLETIRAVRSEGGAKLPEPLARVLAELESATAQRIADAKAKGDKAQTYERQGRYDRALAGVTEAAAADADAWGPYVEYYSGIRSSLAKRAEKDWIAAVGGLAAAAKLVSNPEAARRELDKIATAALRDLEARAANKTTPVRDRALLVRQMDAIGFIAGRSTRARQIEAQLRDSLPKTSIRFDLARTVNDRDSKLYRKVQGILESTAKEYQQEVNLVEVLDHMAAYEGQEGRATAGFEVFVVAVDVVDFDTDAERETENLSKQYLSGYRSYEVPNPDYSRQEANYESCLESTDWDNNENLGKALLGAAGEVAACRSLYPELSRTNTLQEEVYADCLYRVTDHHLFGIAEVRVEMFHVPDGGRFMDKSFRAKEDKTLTEVETRSGDCEEAGIYQQVLPERPTAHSLEEPLLAEIESQVQETFGEALRPTELLGWLRKNYGDEADYAALELGALVDEGGIGALMRELGATTVEFDGARSKALFGIRWEPMDAGARIVEVEGGSPAELSGLAVGDVVLAVDGEPLQGTSDAMLKVFRRSLHPVKYFRVLRHGSRVPSDVVVVLPPS